jgi:hypothetical protein
MFPKIDVFISNLEMKMNLKDISMIYSHFVIPNGVKGSEEREFCFEF